MIYVLGDDPDGVEQLERLKQEVGDADLRQLNTAIFDGQALVFDDLRAACEAMPFLADHRLVIVRGLLSRFEPKERNKPGEQGGESGGRKSPEIARQLGEYLPQIPAGAVLAFVEGVPITKQNPLHKGLVAASARFDQTPPLTPEGVQQWIERRAAAKGGRLAPGASKALAACGVETLRELDLELDKLIAFAAGSAVDVQAINQLVVSIPEANIFKLGDAIAEGNGGAALRQLHELLDTGHNPLYILSMITRQFRLLIQVKDLQGAGLNTTAISGRLRMPGFVVERLLRQLRRYPNFDQLERVYRRLLESDVASKTGRGDLLTNIELLIAEQAGKPSQRTG